MSETTSQGVAAIVAATGHRIDDGEAARIAAAIGPALDLFGAVEGSLPLEAEPAMFQRVQRAEARR